MLTIVYFDPDTGAINGVGQAMPNDLADTVRPWVQVYEYRLDWHLTHRVDLATGEVVPL